MDKVKDIKESLEELIITISKTEEEVKREKYVKKLIDFFIYDLDEQQQIATVEHLSQQISLLRVVNSPELYRKRGNMRIRIHLFNWCCAGVLLFMSGLLFSDTEYVNKINEVINSILKIWGL